MRWEPGQGFLRFERHLARLYGSARELGFSYDPEKIGEALKAAITAPDKALRVRLALSPDGEAEVATQPYQPLPPHKVWNLRIARTRLASGDGLLRHKTSRRDAYAAARSEHQLHQADEVLLLNERDEVCEGTITNVFVDTGDGMLVTPTLACGLLAGVLRAELLAEGRARESVLGIGELMDAERLFVGNSLRGLIPARLNE
jgi:4-amino-4-deoxychorismate lyase